MRFNVILFAISLNQLAKLLAVTPGLSGTDSCKVLKVVERDGVLGGHLVDGDVEEDDIGGHVVLACHRLAKAEQHGM